MTQPPGELRRWSFHDHGRHRSRRCCRSLPLQDQRSRHGGRYEVHEQPGARRLLASTAISSGCLRMRSARREFSDENRALQCVLDVRRTALRVSCPAQHRTGPEESGWREAWSGAPTSTRSLISPSRVPRRTWSPTSSGECRIGRTANRRTGSRFSRGPPSRPSSGPSHQLVAWLLALQPAAHDCTTSAMSVGRSIARLAMASADLMGRLEVVRSRVDRLSPSQPSSSFCGAELKSRFSRAPPWRCDRVHASRRCATHALPPRLRLWYAAGADR